MTPEGSKVLPFGPKNHSKFGEGTLAGRGMGSISFAEHVREKVLPKTPGERVTELGKRSNLTVESNIGRTNIINTES